VAVAQGTDQGRERKLRQGVAAREKSENPAVIGEIREQERKQGKDQRFPQPVVQEGEEGAEDDRAARAAQGAGPGEDRSASHAILATRAPAGTRCPPAWR
jgi:hypothetical protein